MRKLHRGNFLPASAGDSGVRLAPGLITCLAGGALFVLGLGVARLAPSLGVWISYGGFTAAMLFFITTASMCRAAYYTCLYMWAVERERRGSNAPAPDLLRRAIER